MPTTPTNFIVDLTTAKQFNLLNIPGKITHYPRNGTSRTIPDLIFARNYALTMTQGWATDEGEGGESDHVLITTTVNIAKTTFTPRRQHHRTKWDVFNAHMARIHPSPEDYSTPERTLATAEKINQQFQSWWTPEITALKNSLAEAKKKARKNLCNEEYKREQRTAAARWRRAIRRAQWQHWEDTFQKMDRETTLKRASVAKKKKTAMAIPDIQGISDFQGKFQILREAFFPANVATPRPMPEGFLKPATKDLSNTKAVISSEAINEKIRRGNKKSATGTNGVT
ncbi:hypothetical protein Q9L58_010433 [Maublancomyces gigas]|uniref:Endonuclease/exonuclease/phosphatase domain-containing protein n=1 Tax=Discina gigas TaxID=1032678 RepID=A0ABR3G463_9PEZI